MALGEYVAKKANTIKMLFYYRVMLPAKRLRSRLLTMTSRGQRYFDFVIIDDAVPKSAGFRGSEFSFLLQNVPGSGLYSIIGNDYSRIKGLEYYTIHSTEEFETGRAAFCKEYDIATDAVRPFYPWTKINAGLAYIVFLSTAAYMIDHLEERKIPFVLELYPGGGFTLLTEGFRYEQLKRVLGSPYLVKVLTTQVNILEFLRKQKLCPPEKIDFMFGGILNPRLFGLPRKEIHYGVHKDTLDICFAASKYMPKGLDKGYDIFIDLAHKLLQYSDKFQFHIVGGFKKAELPIDPKVEHHFHFHGYLKGNQFRDFYKDKDIFIAPSRPFMLAPGAFDGFPTTTSAEAGLNGVCIIMSDPLKLNVLFDEETEAIFVDNDVLQFYENVIHLLHHPEKIYTIGTSGQQAMHRMHCNDQLAFRLSLVKNILNK